MSEGPQGEGWWIASDGRWYAPELHPDAAAAAPAGGESPLRQPEGGWAAPAGETSLLRQPEGAWAAPAPDPWIARMQAQAAAGSSPTGAGAGDGAGATWAAPGSGPPPRRLRGRGLPRRKAFVVVPGVVLLAGVGVGLAVVLNRSPAPNTPRAVAQQAVADFQRGSLASLCNLVLPSAQQACRAAMTVASALTVTTHDLAVGVVSRQGSEALAVLTGTVCASGPGAATPQCDSNSDPNAALDQSGSFAEAYTRANGSSQSGPSFTLPLIEQGGNWYLSAP